MEREFVKWVVDSAMGYLLEEYRYQEIENLFDTGKPCMNLYCDAIDAYWHLCERLGVESDRDVEIIINSFMSMSDLVAEKMFEYGVEYGSKK